LISVQWLYGERETFWQSELKLDFNSSSSEPRLSIAKSSTALYVGLSCIACIICPSYIDIMTSNTPIDPSLPLSGGESSFHPRGSNKAPVKFGVLTISDRASAGIYKDDSGPEIVKFFHEAIKSKWEAVYKVIPDEKHLIQSELIRMADEEDCCLIVTTGGTGPAKRDVTPEATESICDRMMAGYAEQMRAISLKVVPTAVLSRQTAGLRGDTLIINLPGKPKAIRETIDEVFVSIPACISIMKEDVYIETYDDVVCAFRPGMKKKMGETAPMPDSASVEDDGRFINGITSSPLDIGAIVNSVGDPSCGAISSFVGTTRDTFQGKRVIKLEYEAYIPMAMKKLREICEIAASRWDIHRMSIFHRTGVVPVKEASVVIAVSSAHRKESLECCSWAIDELKATVPIWKKEFFEGGEVWKENQESRERLLLAASNAGNT
jgi:molybdopterin adenylyltransferase